MSNASTYMAIAASWIGSAGAVVTGFLKQAKKAEARFAQYAATIERDVNSILTEISSVQASILALTPTPKPAAAAKAPVKRVADASKPSRRAGR